MQLLNFWRRPPRRMPSVSRLCSTFVPNSPSRGPRLSIRFLTKPLQFNNVGAHLGRLFRRPAPAARGRCAAVNPSSQRLVAREPRRNHAGIRSACPRRKAHRAAGRIQQKSARTLSRGLPRDVRGRASRSRGLLGRTGQAAALVRSSDEKCSIGNRRTRNGSSGGKLNVSYNCLDRHLEKNANKPALMWEAEDGSTIQFTYAELHERVCRFANVLSSLGVKPGDCVAIYMPMIPELPIAMLACARIGAIHSVVFGGFSATALADRIADCKSKILHHRRRRLSPRKNRPAERNRRRRAEELPHHRKIHRRATHQGKSRLAGRPRSVVARTGRKSLEGNVRPRHLDSEHPLYILYTSGTTGKPKGVLHTSAGYLLQCMWSTRLVFDLRDDDIYWCTADIGWVTGHSYIVYGPLSNCASIVMYEGAPDFPQKDRFWEIIERYKVTIFYSSATAVRAFMAWGMDWIKPHDLSSLRLLGTVGEPINPAAWKWYFEAIGKNRCPIVDTWWQTETGSILISPLPGATPTKPGSATLAAARRDRQCREYERRTRRARRNRLPDHPETVALHAAHDLWRRRTLRARILEPHPRRVFRGRRRAVRQGRLHLGARPRGRRHQSRRPPPQFHGNRKRAGEPSGRRGSGGGRAPGRNQRRSHRLLRHAALGPRGQQGVAPRL